MISLIGLVKFNARTNITTHEHIYINKYSNFLYIIDVNENIAINASNKRINAHHVDEYSVCNNFSTPKALNINDSV